CDHSETESPWVYPGKYKRGSILASAEGGLSYIPLTRSDAATSRRSFPKRTQTPPANTTRQKRWEERRKGVNNRECLWFRGSEKLGDGGEVPLGDRSYRRR